MREELPVPENLDGMVWHFLAAKGECRRPAHTHLEWEMNLCVKGQATYLVDSRCYELRQNAMIWFSPKALHELIEWTPDFEMWVVVFRPELIRKISRQTGDIALIDFQTDDAAPLRLLPGLPAAHLTRTMLDLRKRTEQAALKNHGLAYLLALARHEFSASPPEARSAVIHPAVERAVFATATAEEVTNAEEFATRCGLSRSRLSRLFKQQMGISLTQYRNRKRLERFHELYGDGSRRTVLTAALEAGFGSMAQFYRVQSAMNSWNTERIIP